MPLFEPFLNAFSKAEEGTSTLEVSLWQIPRCGSGLVEKMINHQSVSMSSKEPNDLSINYEMTCSGSDS